MPIFLFRLIASGLQAVAMKLFDSVASAIEIKFSNSSDANVLGMCSNLVLLGPF